LLTPEQRHAVDEWLIAVFGVGWPELRIWRYEVVGEGVVQFHAFVWDGKVLTIDTFERTTSTPPPLFADSQLSDAPCAYTYRAGSERKPLIP
jgi:hypothetical protein